LIIYTNAILWYLFVTEMSIAANDLPLLRRGHLKKSSRALKKTCRCRDGIRKNVLISKAVTGLN
jgi:hypothetical protein